MEIYKKILQNKNYENTVRIDTGAGANLNIQEQPYMLCGDCEERDQRVVVVRRRRRRRRRRREV